MLPFSSAEGAHRPRTRSRPRRPADAISPAAPRSIDLMREEVERPERLIDINALPLARRPRRGRRSGHRRARPHGGSGGPSRDARACSRSSPRA